VQNNKQSLSSLKRKTAEGIDDLRPPDANNRINARWTNDELLLAVQGKFSFFPEVWNMWCKHFICVTDKVSFENSVFALWDKCPITYDFMAERENIAPGRCRYEHLKRKLLLLSAATLGFKGSMTEVNVEFLNYWVPK